MTEQEFRNLKPSTYVRWSPPNNAGMQNAVFILVYFSKLDSAWHLRAVHDGAIWRCPVRYCNSVKLYTANQK